MLMIGQVLITDLVDRADLDGTLRKYMVDEMAHYTGETHFFYGNGVKEFAGFLYEGLPDGQWIWWHPYGQKQKKGYFKHAFQDSLWQWWYPNGQLKQKGHFVDADCHHLCLFVTVRISQNQNG